MYQLLKARLQGPVCLLRWLFPLSVLLILTGCGGGSSAVDTPATSVQPGSSTSAPTSVPPPPDPPPVVTPPQPDKPISTIRLLVLISESTRDIYPDPLLRITHLINVANQIAASSGVELDLELAHTAVVSYPDDYGMVEALEAMTLNLDEAFSAVAQLRETHAADLVTLFRPYANDGLCGYAWLGGQNSAGDFSDPKEADFGFSTVAINCSDYTLLHEIGHNLGLAHSRRENPDGGSLPHGVGYGIDNGFVTIMADASAFNAVKLPLLSTPRPLCQGEPCGVDRSDPVAGADAVHALSVSRDQVAAYR
jgi:peptidyl-Asp metalloendopeptidase